MTLKTINKIYFIGIGGIGMSALARYFSSQGKSVSGYDKTSTELTKELEKEGIQIHYSDWGKKVLKGVDIDDSLIVYTPAIPDSHKEYNAFIEAGFRVLKRSQVLGLISQEFETFAVAGTHGKTTTSSILAHVLNQTKESCNAFIGGIATNYNSNCIINPTSKRVVVEADEFDRSFLTLKPNYAIITSMDADHLDIYGDGDQLKKSFNDFMDKVNEKGLLVLNSRLDISSFKIKKSLRRIKYGFSEGADWVGFEPYYKKGAFYFNIKSPKKIYKDIEFGLPGKHNAENALAVFALCIELGIDEDIIRKSMSSFKGVKRRFEFYIRREDKVVIDDYAHHPSEINAFLSSVKQLYPDKKITTVFQPHLFSRTRDFMDEFAESLSASDEVFLLDIYPAREEPIEGVSSAVLLDKIKTKKQLSSLSTIVDDLHKEDREVVLIVGAGDIDTCVKPIVKSYSL